MTPKTSIVWYPGLLWEPVGPKTSTDVKINDPKVSPETPCWNPWPPKQAQNAQKYMKMEVLKAYAKNHQVKLRFEDLPKLPKYGFP